MFQPKKGNAEESSSDLISPESTNEAPADRVPSGSTFLNIGQTVLLDSPATGPWMIVSETGD